MSFSSTYARAQSNQKPPQSNQKPPRNDLKPPQSNQKPPRNNLKQVETVSILNLMNEVPETLGFFWIRIRSLQVLNNTVGLDKLSDTTATRKSVANPNRDAFRKTNLKELNIFAKKLRLRG